MTASMNKKHGSKVLYEYCVVADSGREYCSELIKIAYSSKGVPSLLLLQQGQESNKGFHFPISSRLLSLPQSALDNSACPSLH